jgi:hypothetical protein
MIVLLRTVGEGEKAYQFGQGANVGKQHCRTFRRRWIERLVVKFLAKEAA